MQTYKIQIEVEVIVNEEKQGPFDARELVADMLNGDEPWPEKVKVTVEDVEDFYYPKQK